MTMAAILAVIGVAAWSAARERDVALEELANEEAMVATALAIDFENRLSMHLSSPRASSAEAEDETLIGDEVILDLLSGARRIESQGVMMLVARPGQRGFLTTDSRVIASTKLREAIDRRESTTILTRDEAVSFGLPHRAAVAGLARIARSQRSGPWAVVVVASAFRIRARQQHEQIRLALTTGVVTALLLAAGSFVQRRERRRLELERQVAISTLEREREAALSKADKMAALAALSTGIAHEVGTPLSIILERVDQLKDRIEPDERGVALLKIVTEQIERIQRIVRACLALARGDSPYLVQAEPQTLAIHAAALVRHRFSKAGVALVTEIASDAPKISCEPSLLEQALVNLLLNACEASAHGGRVVLRVTKAPHASLPTTQAVQFVIEDEGEGISEDARAHVTEPFFSTKRARGGSGLGLTIAREIVEHHAGVLSLEPGKDGRGTHATIALKA